MSRTRHPNKHIEAALADAESLGFRVIKRTGRGHAWGILYCVLVSREGCRMSIWSTPRVPENHAAQIRRFVDNCQHG